MANIFKRAARRIGRWTGISPRPEFDNNLPLIEAVSASEVGESASAIDTGAAPAATVAETEAPLVDASGKPWDEALATSATLAQQDTDAAIEAAIASGQFDDASILSNADFSASAISPDEGKPVEFPAIAASVLAQAPAAVAEEAPVVEEVKEVKAPIEIKPEPATPVGLPMPQANVSFTELYELLAAEVDKRTDRTVNVYERLLQATREELEATRKSSRIAWSVGGVMTAFAAFGAIWAAGEVAATRVEVAGLKQQVTTGQQALAERDLLRTQLAQAREASAKVELDSLKARLDQAVAVTAERDRLRGELQVATRARLDSEAELRLARAAIPATQPESQSKPAFDSKPAARQASATETVAGAGAERPDVWSTLLNGDR